MEVDEARVEIAPRARTGIRWAAILALMCIAAVYLAPKTRPTHDPIAAQQKLWYGEAAGRPAGDVLGTWSSQTHSALARQLVPVSSLVRQPPIRWQTEERHQQYLDSEPATEPTGDAASADSEDNVPCDDTCRAQYDTAMTQLEGSVNELSKIQGTCTAMMRLFDCECTKCSPNMEAADVLQTTLCAPEGLAQLHASGGPCVGFATGFCAAPVSSSPFCQEHSWLPPMGSPQWLQGHKVVDPGDDEGAGLRLASNQAPVYATKVARAMSTYLTSGALDARAKTKLQVNLASQIESLKPVHENMGIFDFLPINVPFLMSVDKRDKPVLDADHHEQKANFGEEVSSSEVQDYARKVKDMQQDLAKKGVELPPKVATELKELRDAANLYNGPVDETSWFNIKMPWQ